MELTLKPTQKQFETFQYLRDDVTSFIVFGGGGGGGKSWLGCEWLLTMSIAFPNTRWFIGRNQLTNLMASTYMTWLKVCRHHKFEDWTLNGQSHFIQLGNGSRIDLVDLKFNPSDPLYEDLGSYEFTGGFIEEAGEIDFKAFDVLKTRIGRQMNKEYKIMPKILLTCNPKKNWLYQTIYKPFKNGVLPKEYAFIQSLYKDNPYTSEEYEKSLSSITDRVLKQRLMFGNWEYADDDNALMTYDTIQDLFTNSIVETDEKWIVADIARYGSDKTVFTYWKGLHCYKVEMFEKLGVDEVGEKLKIILRDEKIPYSHCIVDEDGVGGGVMDVVRGVKGFQANRSPFPNRLTGKPDNYRNVKAQCAYLLAELVNAHKIRVDCDLTIKELLSEELAQIKRKDGDKEGKMEIEPKEKQKEMLGRSPDIADTLVMRMYFEFEHPTKDPLRIDPILAMLTNPMNNNRGDQLDYK
jgi:phage terminase large subunit